MATDSQEIDRRMRAPDEIALKQLAGALVARALLWEVDRDQLEDAAGRHPAGEVFYRWLQRQPRDYLWGMIEAYELND
jgi:hypothetical protein